VTGAAYFDIAAQAPCRCIRHPGEVILPRILPGADRLIAYHVVTSGRCFASLDGGEAVPLEAGEVVNVHQCRSPRDVIERRHAAEPTTAD